MERGIRATVRRFIYGHLMERPIQPGLAPAVLAAPNSDQASDGANQGAGQGSSRSQFLEVRSGCRLQAAVMRKWIIGYFAFALIVSAAFAQSYFAPTNRYRDGSGSVDAPVFDAFGAPLGSNYLAEVWGSATPDTLQPLRATFSGARIFAPFIGAGYFRKSEVAFVPNVAPWGWAWLQVRAWDQRLGSTYESVVALGLGGYGESPLFYARGTAGPLCDPPCTPAPLIGMQSFRLRVASAVLMRGIQRVDNQVVIEWAPGFKHYQLQETSDLSQPWQNSGEPTVLTTSTNLLAGSKKFYRVIGLTE